MAEEKEKPDGIKTILAIAIAVLSGVFVIGAFFWFHYTTIKNSWELNAIQDRGIPIKAIVIDNHHTEAGGRSIESHSLEYQYEVDDKVYTRDKYVDMTTFTYHSVGDSLGIKYLENKPWISDIPDNTGYQIQWLQLIVLDGIILLSFIVVLFKSIREARAAKKGDDFTNTEILDDL